MSVPEARGRSYHNRMSKGLQLVSTVVVTMVIAIACGASEHSAPQPQQPAQSGPPNIILIQADDLGFGDLSAYGQGKFADAGDRSPGDAKASASRTTTREAPVCAPSRAALMTGMHTGHAWIRGNGEIPLRPEDVTVAMLLRDAGYRTAVIGKWGLGTAGTTGQPDKKGFEYSFGFLDHRHAHRQFTDHLYRNAERVAVDPEKDYVNDLFTREAESFITRNDPKPFFLYLNYTVPHAELRVPEDSLAPLRGRFPRDAVRQRARRTPTPSARRPTARRSATDRSPRRMRPSSR